LPHATAVGAADTQPIDVRNVIDHVSIDELNKSAEEYFSSLTDWEHHLAKPFSKVDEAPLLLADVATLIQGMRLVPGATVLDFGAGTGWLSRFLTQLGCRAILLDVSPTALRIARELYARQPVIGDRPAPEFLPFDGCSIPLPDASVDRIVSFHAFHHVPNPDDMLREFGRILRPGGIAGFAEPGPRHSRTAPSQFEMRTYQVVENDVNVREIARTARACGFDDMKLVVFHRPPFHVSIGEFEDFLAGGDTCNRWVTSTRQFLRHVRSFFLFKEGSERADSRWREGLACHIDVQSVRTPILETEPLAFSATVKNTGTAVWLSSDATHGGVLLGAHVYDSAGKRLAFDVSRQPLTESPREIEPGGSATVQISLPPHPPGRYLVELDCVARGVIWFAQCGSKPATVQVEVTPVSPRS
jgi:SAM-dependent methyltransferase